MFLYYAIGGSSALLIAAILIVVVALRRKPYATEAKTVAPQPSVSETPAPKIYREKLTMGDKPNPWTHSAPPDSKIDHLLPAFAFDAEGQIHRTQDSDLAQDIQVPSEPTAFAVLALWHAGREEYKLAALKVASNLQIVEGEREMICFLFQDLLERRISVKEVHDIERWQAPAFAASVKVYANAKINPTDWHELEQKLPSEYKEFYELEVAQKSPPKFLYRRAAESRIFSDGLLRLNLSVIGRSLNPRRWQRVLASGSGERVRRWASGLPCENERDALLLVANPEIFEKDDFSAEVAQKIASILDGTNAGDWLFDRGEKPSLIFRRLYFKFFCLFERYNEAVCCYGLLGVFRRERANRLYYARALFSCGMPHESWAEMSALLADFPRDAAILNEAGIYAHKLGRGEEAREIFDLARGLYPDDATIAYNEAIFTEEYSRLQIEQKWTQVQKMHDLPVVD